MTSYIFGSSSSSKCQVAKDLVRQYNDNRETFIEKAIKIIINATETHIYDVALGQGKTEMRVDVDAVIKKHEDIKKLEEELKLIKFKLKSDERKLIIQALIHHFEDNDFKVKNTCNGSSVEIKWAE